MSLQKAVEAVVEDMELRIKDEKLGAKYVDFWEVMSWAKQLRIAMKATEGEQATSMPKMDPEAFHREQIDKARAEFRKNKEEGLVRSEKDTAPVGSVNTEEGQLSVYEVLDGPAKGDHVPMSGDAPVGAYTRLGDSVYQLGQDRKLRYSRPFVQV